MLLPVEATSTGLDAISARDIRPNCGTSRMGDLCCGLAGALEGTCTAGSEGTNGSERPFA